MIANIALFGNEVHVERENVLALKEVHHSLNVRLALQKLLRN
jgi:hypothetical protein